MISKNNGGPTLKEGINDPAIPFMFATTERLTNK